jgi:very-short-patch-repair endonuclease
VPKKGYRQTKEHKEKAASGKRGRTCSDEHKAKVSLSKAGSKNSMYGKSVYDVWLKKHGKIRADELLKEKNKKHSAALKGRPFSIEHKKNLSKALLKRYEEGRISFKFITKDTKPELEVEGILIEMNIKYEKQFRIENTRKFYDFYLPENNMLIEVDGRYWHNIPGARERDIIKNELAKSNGYKLVRIWDDEINKSWNIT